MSDTPTPFNSHQLAWLNREMRQIHDRIDAALGLTPAPVEVAAVAEPEPVAAATPAAEPASEPEPVAEPPQAA